VIWLDPLRQARPGHRQIDGDRRGPSGLNVGDELWQHLAVPTQLKPQRAAHLQVVIQVLGQPAHDVAPSGQGRAMVRSRSTSTRA
jgi:hypothetical protein